MILLLGAEAENALRAEGVPIPNRDWGDTCMGNDKCKNHPSRRMVSWKVVDMEKLGYGYIPTLRELCAECDELLRWQHTRNKRQ